MVIFYQLVLGIVSRILGCQCRRILHQQKKSILWEFCGYEDHALFVLSSLQDGLPSGRYGRRKYCNRNEVPNDRISLDPSICKQLSSLQERANLSNHFRR